jgi:PilZ domain
LADVGKCRTIVIDRPGDTDVIDITATTHTPFTRHRGSRSRLSARHRVELPCEVITSQSNEPALLWATDLSASGLWIDTDEPLDLCDETVVCFKPSVWWRASEIQVFAKVARISRGARGPRDDKGMGLSFLDLTQREKWQLRCWLRPRPEKAASRRALPRFAIPVPTPAPSRLRAASPFASRLC